MSNLVVMVNGIPGSMGLEVAAACLRRGFELAPIALSGKSSGTYTVYSEVNVDDQNAESLKSAQIKLVPSGDGAEAELRAYIETCRAAGKHLVAVDYTHPTAVDKNGQLYLSLELPFVMGTTGGDREGLARECQSAGLHSVIAANMCKQIVALQTCLEIMSQQFPGAFGGYNLGVTESHQSHKADTSGTAKEMVKYFGTLTGTPFPVDQIVKHRDRESQLAFGVPEAVLGGHAFHTYSLQSKDGTVGFEFSHNVQGRRTYAEGTVDAVEFLESKMQSASSAEDGAKAVFNMIDVLKSGGMR